MKYFNHTQRTGLIINEDAEKFKFYQLIDPQKIANFSFWPQSKMESALQWKEPEDFTALILTCSVNAMIAPTEVVEKYFQKCLNYLEEKQTSKNIEQIMDQWAVGFLALWNYDVYQNGYSFFLIASDTLDFNSLVDNEDKKKYLYTENKILSNDWNQLNIEKLLNYKTKEPVYKNGEGKFLLDALHHLDKQTYQMIKEKKELENLVISSTTSHTIKL
jgi:hypothetical protein